MPGYVHCGCRDCMETTIGEPGELCDECEEAGCDPNSECLVVQIEEEES